MERPDWDQYFMKITDLVASRSTCLRRKVGAILVRDKRILATGYNGAPAGLPHCLDIGCLRQQENIPSGQRHELCRAIHAEQNAIIQAARHGVSVVGATLYCSAVPCIICTKMLINAGVECIHFREEYPDAMSQEMLAQAGVKLIKVESP
ncbi:MAG: cytidine/deoxycytidylate deaminase family protein [Pseudomonadota bacterium]